jgi:hypothetical protein
MNTTSTFRGRSRLFLLALLLAACAVGRPVRSFAEDPPTSASPAASAGLKVNVDPKTGRFLETPAPPSGATAAAQPATSEPALEAQPSVVPGGGVLIHMPDERFHADVKASTAPDGTKHVECGTPAK